MKQLVINNLSFLNNIIIALQLLLLFLEEEEDPRCNEVRNSAMYYSKAMPVPKREIKTQDMTLIKKYVVLRQCRANYLAVL